MSDQQFKGKITFKEAEKELAKELAEDYSEIERLQARLDGYKALWSAASNALHKLEQSRFSNSEHEQAKAYLRAALQQQEDDECS